MTKRGAGARLMADRLRLGLIFGGRSVEHEVSVVSAQHVIAAADSTRFEVVPIGVTKSGAWLSFDETAAALAKPDKPFQKRLESPTAASPSPLKERGLGGEVVSLLQTVDVVFPL